MKHTISRAIVSFNNKPFAPAALIVNEYGGFIAGHPEKFGDLQGGRPFGLFQEEGYASWSVGTEIRTIEGVVDRINSRQVSSILCASDDHDNWFEGVTVATVGDKTTVEDSVLSLYSILATGFGAVTFTARPRPAREGLFSDRYTETHIYTGQSSYHSHHRESPNMPVEEIKGHRIGIELEICAKSASKQQEINRVRSNWFYQEHDSSLDSYGIECITIPLMPKDAKSVEFWTPFVSFMNTKAVSWGKSCCGLHVHIGREILGNTAEQKSETLGKLLYFYHHLILGDPTAKLVNEKIYGRAHTYHENLGDTEEGKAVKILGKAVLTNKEVADKVKQAMIDKSSHDRYFDINLQNSATIEFRKGKGSISAERITAIIAWSEAMVDYCRKTSWADLDFNEFVSWVRARRGTPSSLKGFLAIDL